MLVLCLALFLGSFLFHPAEAQTVPDLSIWINTWFQMHSTDIRYTYADIGVKPVPGHLTTKHYNLFAKISSWDSDLKILTVDAYGRDQLGNWNPTPVATFQVNYFAGTQLKFTGWYHMVLTNGSVYSGMWDFKGKLNNQGKFIYGGETFFKTLGTYEGWVADAPDTERQAARIDDLMTMVPVSKVPSELLP
jgi:hypothetical protein